MNIQTNGFTSIEQVTGQYLKPGQQRKTETKPNGAVSFETILKQKATPELKFSKHADERMLSRQIHLSEEQVERLNEGVDRAREKGIKESLVIVDDLAFIVNVRNNTVVTAVGDSDDKIFTNIDGAVIN